MNLNARLFQRSLQRFMRRNSGILMVAITLIGTGYSSCISWGAQKDLEAVKTKQAEIQANFIQNQDYQATVMTKVAEIKGYREGERDAKLSKILESMPADYKELKKLKEKQ